MPIPLCTKPKAEGKARHAVFDTGQFKLVFARWNLETDLRQAIENEELIVYYQPFVSLQSGEIVGAEALLRWQHPQHGLLTPESFIPLAEETGLILPIGEWLLWTACHQLQAWHQLGFPLLRMAVNVSSRQFRDQNLPELVGRVLAETAVPPHCLELEITEINTIEGNNHAVKVLHQLKEMGVRLSMDDFGLDTSLHSLKRLPVDTLKIDQSFVRDTAKEDVKELAIIRAIIAMGHSLDLNIIAEGVESEEQLFLLHGFHCNEIQGFLFSHPVPAHMMTELLQTRGVYRLQLERSNATFETYIHAQASQDVGYALVDEKLNILTHNVIIEKWAEHEPSKLAGQSLLAVFPELVGAEDLIQQMLINKKEDGLDIPRIYRQIYRASADPFGNYFDLRVEPFSRRRGDFAGDCDGCHRQGTSGVHVASRAQ